MATWILVADDPAIGPLVDAGHSLGGPTTAVVAGGRPVAESVAASGVGRVLWPGPPAGRPVEALAGTVADAVAAASPGVVLAADRDADRALAGAVAARLGAPAMVAAAPPAWEGRELRVTRRVAGGIAEESVRVPGPAVVLLGGGPIDAGSSVALEAIPAPVDAGLAVVADRPGRPDAADLGRARRIVAVGRGLREPADLAMVERLADALGAEVACSRPLAGAPGWLSHDRCIGLTGRRVVPELYVALGISGQLQHTLGCRAAGTIVVVNSDPHAPFFAECDLGVVGDLYDVVPALIEELS